MSMYGLDVPFYDYGFSDPAITRSLYPNSFSPIESLIDYEDDDFDTRRRPPRPRHAINNPSNPTHRHDGTSPLPLGMDWSPPPPIWDGRDSVWPHGSPTGWSYCVTIPSWTIEPSAGGSDTVVFFRVQVGIQSPEGITTTRGVLRRFNEFLKLYSELRKEFPKRSFPPAPPRRLMKMRSRTLLEERRCALEDWVGKLLSDIDVSRTAHVAIFLELEAAARLSFYESNQNGSDVNSSVNVVNGLREDSAEGNHEILNQKNMLSKGDNNAINCDDENLEQTIMSERERFTHMQWDMEVLQRKFMELELKLTTEQDARVNAEAMKASTIAQNEILLKELDDVKEEVKNLRKEHDEFTSLRASHSELKQELSRCLEEKLALEKEKQKWEVGNASKVKLLHKCEVLCSQLRECSVNNLAEEEDKLIVDTSSPSDAIDLLAKSDTQIGLLLAEAKVFDEELEAANNDDDELRLGRMLADVITQYATLRKQVNSLILHTLESLK